MSAATVAEDASATLSIDRAHAALLHSVCRAGDLPRPGRWIEQLARSGWACRYLADGVADDGLVEPATTESDRLAMTTASASAATVAEISFKLARLVADLLQDFDGYPNSVQHLALAASALADSVTIASGAIELPTGALAGVPEGDVTAIERWCAEWKTMVEP